MDHARAIMNEEMQPLFALACEWVWCNVSRGNSAHRWWSREWCIASLHIGLLTIIVAVYHDSSILGQPCESPMEIDTQVVYALLSEESRMVKVTELVGGSERGRTSS